MQLNRRDRRDRLARSLRAEFRPRSDMAQLISVKLSRFDGSPWGFRLQGGKDFGTPLIVQKVSPAYSSMSTE